MKFKQFLILLFFTLLSLKNFATHIVGGEIYYDCLGGNNYHITLKLYRDCYNGIPPFDSPATIFIFDSAGVYIDSLQIPAPASITLPFPFSNPCLALPTDICVEEAMYEVEVNLPPLSGGYDFTYARCCRNGTILNLVNPGNVGSTYMAHIPDPGLAVCNSSPRYSNYPLIFICGGIPLNFDHLASDPDGDSLHYELCDAYSGLDLNCPILGPQSSMGCPSIAPPPPASFVPWLSPYSGSYPMSSSPALAVDPLTGLLTGTPDMLGQWVIAICVSEYRNGALLSVNRRDFQFNVVNCNMIVQSLPMQHPFCFGAQSDFTQNSVNTFSYYWDFGVTNTFNDTSTSVSGSWTYADSGTYTVTLIVNPGTICSDTASLQVVVSPPPVVSLTLSPDTVCVGDGGYILTGGSPDSGTYSGLGVIGDYFYPNLVSSGLQNIVYTYLDENNCSNSDTAQLFIKSCLTGQSEINNTETSINIFPNPSRGVFQTQITAWRLAASSRYKIEIYNLLGEMLYSREYTAIQTINEIDLNTEPDGIYFLHFKTEEASMVEKIIISTE